MYITAEWISGLTDGDDMGALERQVNLLPLIHLDS